MMRGETFWLDDPFGFVLDFDNAAKIIPEQHMTVTEQLNSIVRFTIYFTVIMFVIKHDYRVAFFLVFVCFITAIAYRYDTKTKDVKAKVLEKMSLCEERGRGICTLPTKNNPFMNVQLSDYTRFPNRPKACNYTRRPVRKAVNSFFNDGLPKDADDVFQRVTSGRQFYTMPVTTIPNDQTGFANWLYQTPKAHREKK